MHAALEVLDDADTLAERAAGWLANLAAEAGPRFAVALSGGSTPERLFRLLAGPVWRGRIPWERAHLFWGDERCVPYDHPDSNFGMAKRALIDAVPVPATQVHPIPVAPDAPAAAAAYEATLRGFYGAERLSPDRPLFDAVLLGLGEDGHTASLFPGRPEVDEAMAWAVPVQGAKPQDRVSLTLPVLGSARGVAFLVSGAAKRAALSGIRNADPALPAARVRARGRLVILADEAAAG
ncbi:6-phosphogluconolactonase [Roseomonas sp. NAR14]|uniref:6-phosphogluconolactonase n=1 Tax=Roseomonas acroporae TaxID=2937791 RepID=A0A9X1Y450_9PROT|nr:6-phosphogluconolactonase [Roseomonas acroporae]MCK8783594.1 6-phosphogluconolactonase [Roseomonas acroporae]